MQQKNVRPKSETDLTSSVSRFFTSTYGAITAVATFIGGIIAILTFFQKPIDTTKEWIQDIARKEAGETLRHQLTESKVLSDLIQKEIKQSNLTDVVSSESRRLTEILLKSQETTRLIEDLSRATAITALRSEQGMKAIEAATSSLIEARNQDKIDFVYGFSIRFSGSEIAASKAPINRVYFYSTESHRVELSLYFSGTKKFPVDIKVDGKPIKRNIHDIREKVNVTPDTLSAGQPKLALASSTKSDQFLPPIETEEERPDGVHYLELSSVTGYKFDSRDLHDISGIIVVKRLTR